MVAVSADESFHGGGEGGESLFGVGEVHAGVGVGVELVVDAGVAVAHGALDDDDVVGVVDVEDGHAGDGVAGAAGGGVGDVVGTDDEGDVGAGEFGVGLVHFVELGVGDVGFGEQDVHVAGHPAGDGAD